MISSSLFVKVLSTFAMCSGVFPSRGPEFLYANMNGGPNIGFFASPAVIQIGDRGVDSEDCSTDTVRCIDAEGVLIAIPLGRSGYTSSRVKVETIGHLKSQFLGLAASVDIIQAERESIRYRYWYSDELGLLAFSIKVDSGEVMYLLEQKKGLSAGVRKTRRP